MSEALRLADALEQQFPIGTAQHYLDGEAAAELRRLHSELERKSDAIQRLWKERDELRTLNAELVEALQRFSNMYGHLWDSADTKGAGWLSPDSVKAYDDLHELVGELLRKVEASK